MRWLFLFVFSLNLAYIGFELSKSTVDYADVPALKNVQTIVLLSELKQHQMDLAQVEQVAKNVESIAVDQDDSESVETEQNVAESAQKNTEKKSEAAAVLAAQKETESTAAKTAAKTAVKAKAKVAAKVVVNAKQEPLAKSSTVKPSQTTNCFTLGPFRDLGKLRGLTREIKSYVIEADFRGREEKEPTVYWVYLQPEKNHAAAIKTGKRLKAKKIKDFYVIREGEKINGLSLGHFRNRKGAYKLTEKVKKLGFDVTVEPIFKTYTIYWLDYQLANGVSIPASILKKYTKSTKKEKVSRLARDCAA